MNETEEPTPEAYADADSRPTPAGEELVSRAGAEPPAGASPVTDASAAAFFDVDNTLMQGASIYWFARGLAARRFFRTSDLLRFGWQQARFRVHGKEHHGHIADIKESALAFVAGRRVDEVVGLCEEIYDELIAERIWGGTRALADEHRRRGERVWLVTATPVELAEIIARRLGFTGALGTVAEIENGRYTGHLIGDIMHSEAKADAIRALASAEGLDLSRCTAYSDSANDLPMLRAVGNAVAVNPDGELRRRARRNGWAVRDFRTGRKAAMLALPTAVAAGAIAGAVAGGFALRRRRRGNPDLGPVWSITAGLRQARFAPRGTDSPATYNPGTRPDNRLARNKTDPVSPPQDTPDRT